MSPSVHHKNLLYPVLEHLDQQYQQTILPEELERLSCYSYRNLQRIFKSLFGETIGAYQKRIRLENAAKLLHYSDKSITDIAIEVGYGDLQAFRKAFKKQFGQAPSQLRPQLLDILQQLKQAIDIPEKAIEQLDACKVFLPALDVIYYNYIGPYNNEDLGLAWDQLFSACDTEQLDQLRPLELYGLIYDDPDITEAAFCRYDICLSGNLQLLLANPKIAVGQKKIGNQSYMRFTHHGAYEQIENTYDTIFGGWLLQHACNFAEGAVIEHYCIHEDHTDDEMNFKTYLYIPI